MVRDIEDYRLNRMLNWLSIQKRIGYNKIKLYLYRVNKKVEDILVDYGRELDLDLDLVDYRFDHDFLCKHQIALITQDAESSVRKYLLTQCTDFIKIYFDPTRDEVVNSHEIVNTNACLTNFKYEYEFMTNYDFDEILFPRVHMLNDYSNHSLDCKENKPLEYNIYKYARQMVEKHGSHACSFQFRHVLFLDNFNQRFLDDVLSKETGNVKYTYHKHQGTTIFRITDKDKSEIEFIGKSRELVKCLNSRIKERSKFDEIWNSAYAINFSFRLGKSLFVSKLTELYTQHRIDLKASSDCAEYIVPISEGISSHFREQIEYFFTGQLYDFAQFILDVEYYRFLANF